MDFLTVKNEVLKPQDTITAIHGTFTGIGLTGSERKFDFREFGENYRVIFFLPLDSETDFEEVAQLMKENEMFEELGCQMIGVTSCGPFALKMIIEKELKGVIKFPLLCDKDLSLSMIFGVALKCGTPAKGTVILDKSGQVRFIQTQRNDIRRSVDETLRLVTAYQFSDDNDAALKAGWTPNSEYGIIPCYSEEKKKYYEEVYGGAFRRKVTVKTEAEDEIGIKEEGKYQNVSTRTRISIGLIFVGCLSVIGFSYLALKILSGNDE